MTVAVVQKQGLLNEVVKELVRKLEEKGYEIKTNEKTIVDVDGLRCANSAREGAKIVAVKRQRKIEKVINKIKEMLGRPIIERKVDISIAEKSGVVKILVVVEIIENGKLKQYEPDYIIVEDLSDLSQIDRDI
jgi:hypothetical protein